MGIIDSILEGTTKVVLLMIGAIIFLASFPVMVFSSGIIGGLMLIFGLGTMVAAGKYSR